LHHQVAVRRREIRAAYIWLVALDAFQYLLIYGKELLAFLAVLLMLSLMVSQLGLSKEKEISKFEKFEFYRTGLFLSDTIVKNRAREALLGSAFFDSEKGSVGDSLFLAQFLYLEIIQIL